MPYLRKEIRQELEQLWPAKPETAGELNYVLSRTLEVYWQTKGESYQTYNDILGALEGAKLELYRTLIGPYETSKAFVNGALPGQPDLAWAAGFYDGEGSTSRVRRRTKSGVRIGISQKEPLLLLRFKDAVGGVGNIRPPAKGEKCWQYTITRFNDILYVIEVLWPHLGITKRRQALNAFVAWREGRDTDLALPSDELSDWPHGERPA